MRQLHALRCRYGIYTMTLMMMMTMIKNVGSHNEHTRRLLLWIRLKQIRCVFEGITLPVESSIILKLIIFGLKCGIVLEQHIHISNKSVDFFRRNYAYITNLDHLRHFPNETLLQSNFHIYFYYSTKNNATMQNRWFGVQATILTWILFAAM